MTRGFNLNDGGTWDEIYNQVKLASDPHPYYGTPMIPDITIPKMIDSDIIAYKCLVPDAPGTWRQAGRLRRVFKSTILGADTLTTENRTHTLYIGGLNLLIFDKITQRFSITISVPHWIRKVQVVVWEFLGDDYYDFEDSLVELHTKADTIIGLL